MRNRHKYLGSKKTGNFKKMLISETLKRNAENKTKQKERLGRF